jgi:hypothetical protein
MKFKWMYSQEKELKKHRVTMHNKARVEGCITKTFVCKEITNFSSKNFTCANNMNAHTMRYHIVEEVPLSELSIFQWKGKSVGAPSAHYVMDDEWNYTMLCMARGQSGPAGGSQGAVRQSDPAGGSQGAGRQSDATGASRGAGRQTDPSRGS